MTNSLADPDAFDKDEPVSSKFNETAEILLPLALCAPLAIFEEPARNLLQSTSDRRQIKDVTRFMVRDFIKLYILNMFHSMGKV